jgi:hypothetical protein
MEGAWGGMLHVASLYIEPFLFAFLQRSLCLPSHPDCYAIVQITAAHICYLVAEANFEPYSDGARLCLIGANHWKFPRTYASPEAIQVFYFTLCLIYQF